MAEDRGGWYRGAMPRPSPHPLRATQVIRTVALGLLLWGCSCTSGIDAAYNCKAPPSDLAACTTDADCATVEIGCYCGLRPVNGVAVKYARAAQSCEDAAASACALGCANGPGLMAQDGKQAAPGTPVAVRCTLSGASGTCTSYLP